MTTIERKLRYSIKEAGTALGISEGLLRRRIAEGVIESHLDGDRRFISARALQTYIDKAEREAASRSRAAA